MAHEYTSPAGDSSSPANTWGNPTDNFDKLNLAWKVVSFCGKSVNLASVKYTVYREKLDWEYHDG
jgi:hypothetical protein